MSDVKKDVENPDSDEVEMQEAGGGTEKKIEPAKAPTEEDFDFIKTFGVIHKNITNLDGYRAFLCRYIPLQVVRLLAAISPPVVMYIVAQDDDGFDLDNITKRQHIFFGFLGFINVFGRLAPFATKYYIDAFKENLQTNQGAAIVAKIFELPHSNVISTPTGEMVQLISKVFRQFDSILPAIYGAILPVFVEVVFAVIFISVCYGFLGAVQLALFLIYTWISYRAAAQKAVRNKELTRIMISEWGGILAGAQAYERAHLYGNRDYEIKNVRKSFSSISKKMKLVFSTEHQEGALLMFIGLFITGGLIGTLFFYMKSDIEPIEMAGLGFYFVIFMGSLEQYALAISNLRSAAYEYVAYEEFLDRISDVVDIPGAKEIPQVKNPSIEFQNVSFTYDGKEILNNISFKIEGGKTLGLVGPSGCGKSTIMRLLMRFYKASSGVILVDGHDITKVTAKSLRSMFSVVTQDAQLFNGTVRDNISYGKLGSTDEEIIAAASLAELSFGNEVEDISLDKEIGEKGAKLSGGQQQRVSLARAMLKNGTIYLLDEPTTALDAVVAEQLQRTLDKVSEEATTICITHHLNDLKFADQILYLDGGSIVERGNFTELLELKGEFYTQVEARNDTSI